MVFPRTPLDMVTEIFTGDWETLTSDVYNRQPVTIRWGAPNEGGKVEPTRLAQQWNNRSGRYSPRNPTSDLYGLLGRYTPLRFAVRSVLDDFDRTVANGMGSTPEGYAWSTFTVGGSANDFDVAAGVATMVVDGAAEHRSAWLATENFLDVELAVTVTPSAVNITGGSIEPGNLILRAQSVNLYYLARAVITTAEAVQIKLMHEDTGVTTELATANVDGLTYTGQALRVKAAVEGEVLRAKVWDPAGPEPLHWQVSVWDNRITDYGGIGVRNGAASGNSNVPVTFTLDDFEARIPLAHVELSKLPPRADVSQVDRFVPVEGYGIRRRLGQGKTPLRAAPYRYIIAAEPTVFWPLDEGKDVTDPRPAVGAGSTIASYEEILNSIQFGAGELASWLPPVLKVTGSDFVLEFMFGAAPIPSSSVAIDVVRRAQGADDDAAFASVQFVRAAENSLGTQASYFIIGEWAAGVPVISLLYLQHGAGGGTLDTGSDEEAAAFWDFQPHHWRIEATENGADIDVTAYLDGVAIMSGTHSGYGLKAPRSMAVDGSEVQETHLGYFALWTDDIPAAADVSDAVTGHRGEVAADRIERLCGEQGVPVVIVGDPAASEPMGPQATKAFPALLEECEAADHGVLHEPRNAPGFVYRTRASLYNQPERITIPFGDLTPFESVEDDQQARNDITVTRERGGTARAILEEGRLSIQDPPDGIGPVDTSATLNVETDSVLEQHAGWLRHLFTWDESRYPAIPVSLTRLGRDDQAALRVAAAALPRDRLQITSPPDWLTPDTIDQIVEGGEMTLQLTDWRAVYNCAPYGPYEIHEVEATGNRGRVDTGGCVLAEAADDDDTELLATTTDGPPWRTTANGAQTPYDVDVDGERVTVEDVADVASDGFGRTVAAGGWGTADSGQAYTVEGTAANFSVSGGDGLIAPGVTGSDRIAHMDVGAPDQDAWVLVDNGANPSGGIMRSGLVLRYTDASNHYRFVVSISTAGVLTAEISRRAGGTLTDLASAVVVATNANNFYVRGQIIGSRLRIKVWNDTRDEPVGWALDVEDDDLTTGDRLGIFARRETGHTTPTTQSFEEMGVTNPQILAVTRSVNGVVKPLAAGKAIRLWRPGAVAK